MIKKLLPNPGINDYNTVNNLFLSLLSKFNLISVYYTLLLKKNLLKDAYKTLKQLYKVKVVWFSVLNLYTLTKKKCTILFIIELKYVSRVKQYNTVLRSSYVSPINKSTGLIVFINYSSELQISNIY